MDLEDMGKPKVELAALTVDALVLALCKHVEHNGVSLEVRRIAVTLHTMASFKFSLIYLFINFFFFFY